MKNSRLLKLLKKNWILIVIFLAATLIRVWDIPGRIIFFDDAAYDVRVAQQAVSDREVPLLGIPSSVPRFEQGPLAVWFNMALNLTFGSNIVAYSLFYIILSLLALVFTYEFSERYLGKKFSIIVSTLIAFSPFAIAQARMPYHTNPIPFAVILYLFALVRLFEKKKHSLFYAILAWAFLFQFELATFPTLLLIPYVLYRTKQINKVRKQNTEILAGFSIGLLPQIIYDIGHGFSQLGLFILWVGYRIISLFGGSHSFGEDKIKTVVNAFAKYGGRVFSTDVIIISLVVFAIILFSFVIFYQQYRKKKVEKPIEVLFSFTLVLSGGYLAHGGPSEAYFPPFIILLPMIVTYGLMKLFAKRNELLIFLIVALSLFNIRSVFAHNFFVSNNQEWSYSYSVNEQKEVVDFILSHSGGDFQLDTTREIRKFKSVFDNLRFFVEEKSYSENKSSKKYYYIEDKKSLLRNDPIISVKHFPSVDVYYYEE